MSKNKPERGAEAIARTRLERLHRTEPLRMPPEQAAQVMVAASNTVVQLAQQGMPPMQVSEVNTRLQQALLQALTQN